MNFSAFTSLLRPAPVPPPRYMQAATRWLVLQQGANPSTDFYIRPRAESSGLPATYRDIDTDSPSAQDLQPGTRVVIVRYLTPAWAAALKRSAAQLAEVIYFMDDELLDVETWRHLPTPYQAKLKRYCHQMRHAREQLVSTYWGSTPELCARHPDLDMHAVAPLRLAGDIRKAALPLPKEGAVQIFYHGTAAHLGEMHWLKPVMSAVLQACPQAHFEVFGDHEVNRLFRELPRTRVIHPMSWPNYLSHCRAMRGHIGLAPLLPGRFNAGRSQTKVFDIERCGAVGVFAQDGPYAGHLDPSAGHVALPMEAQAWINRLCALAGSAGPA